jgi:hypothetical protein
MNFSHLEKVSQKLGKTWDFFSFRVIFPSYFRQILSPWKSILKEK